jgi:hypothetical protein
MDDPLPKLKESAATPHHLQVLSEVISSMPYWEMKPANEVVSANGVAIDRVAYRTTFALAKSGVCYLVYASRGGNIDIALDKGDYLVKRIDPRTGKTGDLGKTAGGKFTAKLPADQDALLLIKDRRLAERSGGKP